MQPVSVGPELNDVPLSDSGLQESDVHQARSVITDLRRPQALRVLRQPSFPRHEPEPHLDPIGVDRPLTIHLRHGPHHAATGPSATHRPRVADGPT